MNSKEALSISRAVAEEIEKSVSTISLEELYLEVGMGKDGTPTKKVDMVAEKAALSVLKDYDFTIVSEEAGVIGDGETIVTLDPIDGTFNSGNNIPFYSVALSFSNGDRISDIFFGYVKNFGNGVEYWADKIAFRDGRKIRVSDKRDIRCNAIVYYPERKFGFKRIRIMGSAALEICLVADGTFDCFIDYRGGDRGYLRVYDIAASIHIAKCAGGIVSDPEGKTLENKKIDMDERFRIVVSNKFLHPLLLEALK